MRSKATVGTCGECGCFSMTIELCAVSSVWNVFQNERFVRFKSCIRIPRIELPIEPPHLAVQPSERPTKLQVELEPWKRF